jgi:pimeloyl-ACP methyl ester carboxylesterase
MTTRERVSSADGTRIAVEVSGTGRPVVLIGGAFNDRTSMTGLAQVLSPYCQVVIYDRRGRGDSGDVSADYQAEREMEDLRAVIGHVGGRAALFGHSSGAVLALEAARRGLPVERVTAYETPYIPDGSRPRPAEDVAGRLLSMVRDGDRDGATALFQTEVAGLPAEMVAGMRQSDMWGYLTGLAHSLPYDCALFRPGFPVPAGQLAEIGVPVLAIAGSNTFPWIFEATEQVARAIPGGRFLALDGQDHGVLQQPEALLACLKEFLSAAAAPSPRVVSVAAGVESTDRPVPVRDSRYEALEVLIGKWINEGRTVATAQAPSLPILTSDVYERAPGGFFVVHSAYGKIGDNSVGGVEIIGVDGGGYRSTFYDSFGNTATSRLEIDGDVIRWAGAGTRCTVTLTDGGLTQVAQHEASADGTTWVPTMDVTLRKIA